MVGGYERLGGVSTDSARSTRRAAKPSTPPSAAAARFLGSPDDDDCSVGLVPVASGRVCGCGGEGWSLRWSPRDGRCCPRRGMPGRSAIALGRKAPSRRALLVANNSVTPVTRRISMAGLSSRTVPHLADAIHVAVTKLRSYNRAAIKFRGLDTVINFNLSDYEDDLKQMAPPLLVLYVLMETSPSTTTACLPLSIVGTLHMMMSPPSTRISLIMVMNLMVPPRLPWQLLGLWRTK